MPGHPEFPIVNDPSIFGEDPDAEEQPSVQRSTTEPQEDHAEPPSSSPKDTSNIGTVESDVPIPSVSRRKYPFDNMEPGDSFEVTTKPVQREKYGSDGALKRLRSSLSSSATSYCKRASAGKNGRNLKMVIRKTGDHSLRCWCVEAD